MDAELLRAGFRIGFLIAILAVVMLPFQDPSSAEFVVTVLALVVGSAFLLGLALLARHSNMPMPGRVQGVERDKVSGSRYNGGNPPREGQR